MNCPHCHSDIPDNSAFCNHCGAELKITAPTKPKSGGITAKKVILWAVLGLILVLFTSRVASCIRRDMVKETDLEQLVGYIDTGARKEMEHLDPFIDILRNGRSVNTASTEFLSDRTGATIDYVYYVSYINSIMSRKGWKSDEYRTYEELYETYRRLHEFGDSFAPDGTAENAAELIAQYEELVQTYRKCLRRVS